MNQHWSMITDQETITYYYEERKLIESGWLFKVSISIFHSWWKFRSTFWKLWNLIWYHSTNNSLFCSSSQCLSDVVGPSIALRRNDRSTCANLDRLFESSEISSISVTPRCLAVWVQLSRKSFLQADKWLPPHHSLVGKERSSEPRSGKEGSRNKKTKKMSLLTKR